MNVEFAGRIESSMVYNLNEKTILIECGDSFMKTSKQRESYSEIKTWEETSGFLAFLSSIRKEVEHFNEQLGFGIESVTAPLQEIDGDKGKPHSAGFVLERKNPLMPEFRYCLYSLLENKVLYGYIGVLTDGKIRTVKQLQPIQQFTKGRTVLHEWLTQLVRASCEKIML
jgi:hypothetical protein